MAAFERGQREAIALLRHLEQEIRVEPRDVAWASEKETAIRNTFAELVQLQTLSLADVSCHTERCALLVELSATTDPEHSFAAAHSEINAWISSSQPCPYTLIPSPDASGASEVRLLIDCGS